MEQHSPGALLDSIATVVQFASTMTWKGIHPTVELVTSVYHKGVKLSKEAIRLVEAQLIHDTALGKWFIGIVPAPEMG